MTIVLFAICIRLYRGVPGSYYAQDADRSKAKSSVLHSAHTHMHIVTARRFAATFSLVSIAGASLAHAQDRLKSMPGYDRYQRMAPLISTALGGSGRGVGRGSGSTVWS